MEYEWDAAKSKRNRLERALPFELAVTLFYGPVIVRFDTRRDYGEVRMLAVGTLVGKVVLCVYNDRGTTRRIINLRRANRRERNAYRAAQPVGD